MRLFKGDIPVKRQGMLTLLLACLLLAACGRKQEESGPPSGAPLGAAAYTAEFTAFPGQADGFFLSCVSGEAVYVADTRRESILRFPLEGGEAQALPAYASARAGDRPASARLNRIRAGEGGTIWTVEDVYWFTETPGDTHTFFLRQLDGEGAELFSFSAPGLDRALEADTVNDMLRDGDGDIYAVSGRSLALLDPAGEIRFTLPLDSDVFGSKLIRLSDGRVGALSQTRDVSGNTAPCLQVVDKESRDWGETYPLPARTYPQTIYDGGGEALFYYLNGESLYGWRQGAEAGEEVLNWMAASVDGTQVKELSLLPDGRLAAVMGAYSGTGAGFFLLTPAEAGSLPERQKLTYGTMDMVSSERTAILEFNRTNPDYYIEATDYAQDQDRAAGRTRLVTEVLAGKGPDIMNVRSLGADRWETAGLLEDLWPYIDADPDLDRGDLMEHVFQVYERDGKLYQIGSEFRVMTLTGAAEVVGREMSWTAEDLWAALETMPEGCVPLSIFGSRENMLRQLLGLYGERFVDWEAGTCEFESQEFKDLLAFCASLPDQGPEGGDAAALVSGRQMLCEWQVTNFYDVQQKSYLLGGEVTFVGYPNPWGEVGSALFLTESLAMSSGCAHKDGAWAFLRALLLPKEDITADSANSFACFPTNKSNFQRMAEVSMTPVRMEESGREVSVYSESFGELDGVALRYDRYAVTQAEYDQIMALYEAAKLAYRGNPDLNEIVVSAAGAYFAGDKSVDEAAAQIQSRAEIYVNEQR